MTNHSSHQFIRAIEELEALTLPRSTGGRNMSQKRKWRIKKIGKGWWIGRGHFALGNYYSTWEHAMRSVEYLIKEETGNMKQKISQLLIEAFKQDEGSHGGNWVDFAPDGRTVLDGDWDLEEVAQFLIDRGVFIKEEL